MQMIGDHPDIIRVETTGYIEDEKAEYQCSCCECEIYEGEVYFEIEEEIYCEDCLNDIFKRWA